MPCPYNEIMNIKIGIGYDVHRFAENRDCIIGGVKIDHDRGLLGHSDADVLLHAISDALLGALNLGDIGEHFPDNDPQFKGVDSKLLLKKSYELVCEKGYRLNNLDTIVVCERPKLKAHKKEIQNVIAGLLDANPELVSVKATTEEKMGFTGTGEGIKAWAYVSLIKDTEYRIQNTERSK